MIMIAYHRFIDPYEVNLNQSTYRWANDSLLTNNDLEMRPKMLLWLSIYQTYVFVVELVHNLAVREIQVVKVESFVLAGIVKKCTEHRRHDFRVRR
jgi:hypothetical protein